MMVGTSVLYSPQYTFQANIRRKGIVHEEKIEQKITATKRGFLALKVRDKEVQVSIVICYSRSFPTSPRELCKKNAQKAEGVLKTLEMLATKAELSPQEKHDVGEAVTYLQDHNEEQW